MKQNLTAFPVVEKERKKAEKNKKFAEKQAKTKEKAAAPAASSKTKEKKVKAEKEEPLPEYVEETKPGEKKSTCELRILRPLPGTNALVKSSNR